MFIKLHNQVNGHEILINLDNVISTSPYLDSGSYVDFLDTTTIKVKEKLEEIETIIKDKLMEIPYIYKYLPTPINDYGHGWNLSPIEKVNRLCTCKEPDYYDSCKKKLTSRKAGPNF